LHSNKERYKKDIIKAIIPTLQDLIVKIILVLIGFNVKTESIFKLANICLI